MAKKEKKKKKHSNRKTYSSPGSFPFYFTGEVPTVCQETNEKFSVMLPPRVGEEATVI